MPPAPDLYEKKPGFLMLCGHCKQSYVDDPRLNLTGLAASEKAKLIAALCEPAGWKIETDSAGVATIICPLCAGGKYDPACRCPMCLHDVVSTRFCRGSDCDRGMVRRHLHRVCERCKYDFVQGAMADEVATDAQ